MEKLITHNGNALRFLMTEDIYVLKESPPVVPVKPEIRKEIIAEITQDVVIQTIPAIQEPIPIVQKTEPIVTAEEVVPLSFNYLGENNRYFLILVDDKSHADLNSVHKDMLMKIMGAKKLELRDLAIVNLAKYPAASFPNLKEFFSCNRIVLFGIGPTSIGLPALAANQPGKHQDVKILATFSLDEMSNSVEKKKEFWNVMKDF